MSASAPTYRAHPLSAAERLTMAALELERTVGVWRGDPTDPALRCAVMARYDELHVLRRSAAAAARPAPPSTDLA